MSLSHESVGRQLADLQFYGIDRFGLVRSLWQGHDEYQFDAPERSTCALGVVSRLFASGDHFRSASTTESTLWPQTMLTDIDERGGVRELYDIDYRDRFDRKWNEFTQAEQLAIDAEIERILDALIRDPDRKWGAIMNTSIEGGKVNPFNGTPGDWSGTPWDPIWERHGRSDEQAALFFGTLWKLRIIQRPEKWIGIRSTDENPTFPNRGINLSGKTYFLAPS